MEFDINEDLTGLTEKQLRARRQLAAEARQAIISGAGDDAPMDKLTQAKALRDYIAKVDQLIVEAMDLEDALEPTPDEPKAKVKTETVEATTVVETTEETPAEDETPAEEDAPAEDADQATGETESQESDDEARLRAMVDEALSDPEIMAKFQNGVGAIEDAEDGSSDDGGQGASNVTTDDEHLNGLAVFASSSFGDGGSPSGNGHSRLSTATVAQKLRNVRSAWGEMSSTEVVPLYQTHANPDVSADTYLGDDVAANTALLFGDRRAEMIAAAAPTGLGQCGDPVRITVGACPVDASTPFMDRLSGNTISARICVVEWELPLDFATITPGPQFWTSDGDDNDQSKVDPADRSTWKPVSSGLPDCPSKCKAYPFDTVVGLAVELNDEICRPEKIAEANQAIEVAHAIMLEKKALDIFDHYVGESHHFALDALETGLGALPTIEYALMALTSTFGFQRTDATDPGGLTAAMHPSILRTIMMDMSLAEQDEQQAEAVLRQKLRNAGIGDIVWLKDFGNSEGDLCAALPSNEILCDISNKELPLIEGPTGFGMGGPLPALAGETRIRLFNSNNWYHGWDWLIDYSFRKSPEMMEMNTGRYFGERRDLLFKASNCGAFEANLDIFNLCATGQRVEASGTFPCNPGAVKLTGAASKLERIVVQAGPSAPAAVEADAPAPANVEDMLNGEGQAPAAPAE